MMFDLHTRHLAFPLIGATLLAGCATYAPPPPSSYSYFAVPCDMLGAVLAVPIPAPDAAAPSTVAPPTAAPPPAAGTAAADGIASARSVECLIAVAGRGRGVRGRYYYPYPYRGYYGTPFYGSLGIGIGFAGHHHRSRHFAGGHVGRPGGAHH